MQQIDKKNLIKFGKRIRELRQKTGLSLNGFAFSHGLVTSATWSRIENAQVDLKFSTLLKVAHMLGISVDYLLKDIDFDYNFYDE